MSARLAATEQFYTSLVAFEDSDELAAVAEKLIIRAVTEPRRVEPVGDTALRVVRAGEAGTAYEPLRLYYTVDDHDLVTLLWLEHDRA